LAAKLKSALGANPTLIAGGGGIFDVTVNGQRVYSKHQTGSFPDEAQLVKEIASMQGRS
jgi:selenoprotein W-related protein